jgi:2-isopropylmalate synthase
MTISNASAIRTISIFDTTLRDGEQAPGNAMRPEQKLAIALQLEALGVDVIEVGFPASSSSDRTAAELISKALTRSRFASFCRAVGADVKTAVDAGGTDRHQIQVLATGSQLHLEHKRGISRDEAVREVRETLVFARDLGVTDLSVGIEDSTRGDQDLLHALVDGSLEAGVGTIVLGDTSGCLLPEEYAELVALVRAWLPSEVLLSTHCHDDFGLAVANALAGVSAGADEVQVTLAGIGERAGNTALEEFAAAILYKGEKLGLRTTIRTEDLFGAFGVLAEAISLEPLRTKAIFGTNAFATQAGIHQAGILRKPETYEYLEPGRFGRSRTLLVGRHSGRAVLRYLLDQLSVEPDEATVDRLYNEYVLARPDGSCDALAVLRERLAGEFGTRQAGFA